jgi:RNA polymerase sigma factor (sigma-70 family)
MALSDQELILASRRGDAAAWESLVEKYERLVYSIPLNYGLSREDAADIAQLTFTILLQSLDSLRDDSRLGAWLAMVARRHTWRLVNRQRRESPPTGEELSESLVRLPDPAGSRPMEQWEIVQWLDQGLSRLDDSCRQLLLALYFDSEEPSYAEVSQRLGMPMGSIGPTRARCLERLKRFLDET